MGRGVVGEFSDCPKCEGSELMHVKLPYIEEHHPIPWQYSGEGHYEVPCDCCINGYAGTRCLVCQGQGGWDADGLTCVDDRAVDLKYHHLVSHLPGVEFLPRSGRVFCGNWRREWECQPEAVAIQFRFAGGRGLLMPVGENEGTCKQNG